MNATLKGLKPDNTSTIIESLKELKSKLFYLANATAK